MPLPFTVKFIFLSAGLLGVLIRGMVPLIVPVVSDSRSRYVAYLEGEGSSCPRRDMMLINVLIPENKTPEGGGGTVRQSARVTVREETEATRTHPSSSCTCGGLSCLRTWAGGCRSWRGSCGHGRDSCQSWGGDWGESWRAGGWKEGVSNEGRGSTF